MKRRYICDVCLKEIIESAIKFKNVKTKKTFITHEGKCADIMRGWIIERMKFLDKLK